MMTVWGRADSSNVQAVMWTLGELGLSAIRHDVGHRFGGTDTPEFLAMNPNGTVPVFQDADGPVLWESGAILRYLANAYATSPFWPDDPIARADVDRWAEWSKVNIASGFSVPIFWPVLRGQSFENYAPALIALEKKLQIAEGRLAHHRYLVGEEFTLADIQFGYNLYRYFTLDLPRAELPALTRYYADLTERPAFAEHVMVSYDALRTF
ncbi:MAG: glutathione S-transferase family protein [Pseudomonadota bacterium]